MELTYFLKINLALALFYAFYRLCCTRDTFFRLRRFTLLAFWMVAWLYPLISLQGWMEQQEPVQEIAVFYAENVYSQPVVAEVQNEGISFVALAGKVLLYVYLAGVLFFMLRFLLQLGVICRLAWRSPVRDYNGVRVHLLTDDSGPFSFFGWIFVHPSMLENTRETDEILDHERTHVRQWHSLDVILSELNCILCWMNPFSHLLKQEARHNLEYLADQRVLATGHDTKAYQYHLLGLTHHKTVKSLYNHFNVLPIKKRIIMMNKKRTHRIGRMKYAGVFLPLAAILILLSHIDTVARTTRTMYNQLTEEPASTEARRDTIATKNGKVVRVSADNVDLSDPTALGLTADELKSFKPLASNVSANATSNKKVAVNYNIALAPEQAPDAPQEKASQEDPDKKQEIEQAEAQWDAPGDAEAKKAAMFKFIEQHLKYPEKAKQDGVQGSVIVRFEVTKDGDVINATVRRSLSSETDAEALRIVSIMPKWKFSSGQYVHSFYNVPIQFTLPKEKADLAPPPPPLRTVKKDVPPPPPAIKAN